MSIFSFLKKNKEQPDSDNVISGTTRDFSTFNEYDTTLKVWLPEAGKIALEQMSKYSNTPITDIIRHSLYTYLYGRYDLMSSVEQGKDEFAMKGLGGLSVALKPPFNRAKEMGKNMYDVKVHVPSKMKAELQELADEAGLKLSEFVREVMISILFGHTYSNLPVCK